ncbi:MAG: hypothetical protein AB9866_10025 [Syntrophobacteraceae bacterium]
MLLHVFVHAWIGIARYLLLLPVCRKILTLLRLSLPVRLSTRGVHAFLVRAGSAVNYEL